MNKNVLKCAAAKADITPDEKLVPDLYALMGIPYGGIWDTLALRVLAIDNGESKVLIISFDLDKSPNPKEWLAILSAKFDIPEENIIYVGTHTHSAPLTTFRPSERKCEYTDAQKSAMAAYEAFVLEQLTGAVGRALADLKPARIGWAEGTSYINVMRNATYYYEDEDGNVTPFLTQGASKKPVDPTLFVLKAETLEGQPIAFLVNYPVHCCTMFLNKFDEQGRMGISGDIAGNVSTYIEAKYPGAVALWTSGAAGNINPLVGNEVFYPDPETGKACKYDIADGSVADRIMLALAARHFADIKEVIRTLACTTGSAEIQTGIDWARAPKTDSEETYDIRMHYVRIGDLALIGIGGELYNSLGAELKECSKAGTTIVLNHDASIICDGGYIKDDETLKMLAETTIKAGMVPGGKGSCKIGYISDALKDTLNRLQEK